MHKVERVPLDFSNLRELADGRIEAMLAVHLTRAARDCLDRPGETKPRKVTLQFEFVPVLESEGYADRADCAIACKSNLPNHVSPTVQVELNPQGFLFNKHVPESLDQHSFDEVDGFSPDDDDE